MPLQLTNSDIVNATFLLSEIDESCVKKDN